MGPGQLLGRIHIWGHLCPSLWPSSLSSVTSRGSPTTWGSSNTIFPCVNITTRGTVIEQPCFQQCHGSHRNRLFWRRLPWSHTRRRPSSSWSIYSDPSLVSKHYPVVVALAEERGFPNTARRLSDHVRFRGQVRKRCTDVAGQERLVSKLSHVTVGTRWMRHHRTSPSQFHATMFLKWTSTGLFDQMFPRAVWRGKARGPPKAEDKRSNDLLPIHSICQSYRMTPEQSRDHVICRNLWSGEFVGTL